MKESDLALLPSQLARHSIDEREIVLPLPEAIAAINHLERSGWRVLGWEGWLLYPDGRKGHSSRHQGTTDLSKLAPSEAAEFCRKTIRQGAAEWEQAPERPGAALYFCITVAEAAPSDSADGGA